MSEVNVFAAELTVDEGDPQGYQGVGYARLGPLLGAEKLGMTVYELPPGTSNCPYHYEFPDEEWVIVLSGHRTERRSSGRGTSRASLPARRGPTS